MSLARKLFLDAQGFGSLPPAKQLQAVCVHLPPNDLDRLEDMARQQIPADYLAVACGMFDAMMKRRATSMPKVPAHLDAYYDPAHEELFGGPHLHDVDDAVALRRRLIASAEASYRYRSDARQGRHVTNAEVATIFGPNMNRAARHRRKRRYL